jgi:aspartate aminotransferase-like enzyme
MNLRIPGPTPLPRDVRDAMCREMVGHRDDAFETLLAEVMEQLRHFYQTQSDVLVLTASGTGGLEAAVVNNMSSGDAVLAVSCGSFGERFAAIARAFGGDVKQLEFPWGRGLDAAQVGEVLERCPDVRLLLTTHNETSTGVLNDLAAVADVLASLGARRPLWLVDAISSLGAVDLPMDAWGCDVVISASQKAWMAPPGLAFMGVSQRAWTRMAQATCPRFYWDLATARDYAANRQTPFTPAVSTLFALHVSLSKMRREGLETIVGRHQALAKRLRHGVRQLGLRLLASDVDASPTVTAVCLPEGVSAVDVKRQLASRHQVAVATGTGALKDSVLRIAHMGYCSSTDIDLVLAALRTTLQP